MKDERPSTRATRTVLGLMSGTSADGIDAVAVRIHGCGADMRAAMLLHHHRRFPAAFRRRLLAVMAPADTRTEELARVHAELGDWFGQTALEAIQRLGRSRRPELIGLAGQTVCHLPGRQGRTVTLQLGEAARVAERTGVTVVSDFRQSDVAAGGQGAPLVPWTDWLLFRHPTRCRAVQNIGGIGNVTFIPAAATAADVVAFDTGPGNMIIDGLVQRITGGRQRFDRDGRLASKGKVLPRVLDRWLDHPYFGLAPPKTTGREVFGATFIESELPRLRKASRSPHDWIATATAFTAYSIASSYYDHLLYFNRLAGTTGAGRAGHQAGAGTEQRAELILCGGGAANRTLVTEISSRLPTVSIVNIEVYGISAQAKEGLSFALLAAARVDGIPSNLPQVTGANRPVPLGRVILV